MKKREITKKEVEEYLKKGIINKKMVASINKGRKKRGLKTFKI